MVKVSLKYVTIYGNGSTRQQFAYYRRKIDGKWRKFRIRGRLGTPEWHLNYQRIHDSFETKKKLGPQRGTLGAMIAGYYRSRRYQVLKPKTRSNYRCELERIPEKLLQAPSEVIKRPVIVQLCEKIAETSPRRSIEMAKALSQVFKNALNRGLIEVNPLSDPIEKPVDFKATPWRPWTDQEISKFLAGAHPLRRRAVMVLLYSGLRRGDATQLRRSDIQNGRITLATGKTGAQVVIAKSDGRRSPNLI